MEFTLSDKQAILVVDDDPHILEVLEARLSSAKFRVFIATGAQEALNILNGQQVDLLITDVRMPGIGGMDLFREVRTLRPDLPVVFMTAYGTIPDTVSAIKAGAQDYLTKPLRGRDLILKVGEILKAATPKTGRRAASPPFSEMLYGVETASMRALYELIERVTPSDVNVLILGESGVGKELVARLLHQQGPRRERPFVVVDCGSTPTGLLESELFGHVKGSFTHAIRDKTGLIEAADGGTLFLDEIGNISAEMQVRLLRFLEERKIRKVGDLQAIPVDCRIISATNLDLPGAVAAGRFREDLYYRLRVVTLQIPPLRERKEDIPLLAQRFVEDFCRTKGCPQMRLPSETIGWLCDYPWPGNVRELKNALEGAVTLCRSEVLRPTDFQLVGVQGTSRLHSSTTTSLCLQEGEQNLILRALEKAGWVQKDAAKLLGISRRALHYKIKKYGINPDKK
jgi:DNA-binding NtrC family response regulator